jgi:hypothetical protein
MSREMEIQGLLIKAEDVLKTKSFSDFKFIREYQEAVIKYIENVMEAIGIGLALKLDVNPDTIMKKSFKVPLITLKKAAFGREIENELFYKSLFSKLKEKFKVAKDFFKKFNFNKGKPLEPLQIKAKIKYNPETGMPLTEKEWKKMSDNIVDFLGDKVGNLEEEMVVRAGLFGKLMQAMEEEGLTLDEQKKMSYEDLENKYGKIPQEIEEAEEDFDLSTVEKKAIQYSRAHAGEHLSIENGSLKNKIVNMVRQQITGGLQDGISAQEMVQRLFWIDPADELGKRFDNDTIKAINRDFRRIALTEISYAMSNGYLSAVKTKNDKQGKKTYLIYSGSIIPTSSKQCIKWRGETVLLVDKPMENDKIQDPHAKYAVWIGKNNVGRNANNWWICIPQHPNCIHYWEEINPEEEYFDEDVQKIMYKV